VPTERRIAVVINQGLAYCRGIIRGIKRFADERPDWVVLPVDADPRAVQCLRRLQVDGMVAHVATRSLWHALSPWEGRLVNVAWVLPDLPVPSVGPDHREVGRLAAEHLLERGFGRFGYVGHRDYAFSVLREEGFRRTLEASGASLSVYYDRTRRGFDPMGRLWALDARLRSWAAELRKPAAVFAPDDIWGLQVSEAARQAGLRIPDDLALLGVDADELLCELARPPMSSVSLPTERIGFEAATILAGLLGGRPAPDRPVLLPPLGVSTRQSTDVLAIDDAEVVAAVRYIRANAHRAVRVDEVALDRAIPRRTLERKFFLALGRGIAAQIRREHLELAKHLLIRTDFSMAEVAERAGFGDPYQFSTTFRRGFGIPPSAFRRQMRLVRPTKLG
jgi:LacI family transcriptional regulator